MLFLSLAGFLNGIIFQRLFLCRVKLNPQSTKFSFSTASKTGIQLEREGSAAPGNGRRSGNEWDEAVFFYLCHLLFHLPLIIYLFYRKGKKYSLFYPLVFRCGVMRRSTPSFSTYTHSSIV